METPIKVEHEPATLGENIRQLNALIASPGWAEFLLPEIQRLEKEHTEAAINPGLNAETRAQHIESIHVCRALADFPQKKINQLKAAWKNKQKPQPTA